MLGLALLFENVGVVEIGGGGDGGDGGGGGGGGVFFATIIINAIPIIKAPI